MVPDRYPNVSNRLFQVSAKVTEAGQAKQRRRALFPPEIPAHPSSQ